MVLSSQFFSFFFPSYLFEFNRRAADRVSIYLSPVHIILRLPTNDLPCIIWHEWLRALSLMLIILAHIYRESVLLMLLYTHTRCGSCWLNLFFVFSPLGLILFVQFWPPLVIGSCLLLEKIFSFYGFVLSIYRSESLFQTWRASSFYFECWNARKRALPNRFPIEFSLPPFKKKMNRDQKMMSSD